jgi:dGTPase
LEGVVKHNGPVVDRLWEPAWGAVASYMKRQDLRPATYASAEAQIGAIADDIAYNNHDVDDGLQAGLFSIEDLLDVPLIGPVLHGVRKDWPGLDARMMRLEAVRRMIGFMIEDVLAETERRVHEDKIQTAEDVRVAPRTLIAFSETVFEDLSRLRAFLHERMYRHFRVNRMRSQAKRILADMFALFVDEPEVLPPEWYAQTKTADREGRARVVCDYIAGMTDGYAIEEHHRLFNLNLGREA